MFHCLVECFLIEPYGLNLRSTFRASRLIGFFESNRSDNKLSLLIDCYAVKRC